MSNWCLLPENGTIQGMKLRVKELRAGKGWTLDTLAEQSGMTKGFLSQLENGRRMPSAATLSTLAEVFAVSVSDLLASEDAPDDPLDAQILTEIQKLSPQAKAAILAAARAFRGPGQDGQN